MSENRLDINQVLGKIIERNSSAPPPPPEKDGAWRDLKILAAIVLTVVYLIVAAFVYDGIPAYHNTMDRICTAAVIALFWVAVGVAVVIICGALCWMLWSMFGQSVPPSSRRTPPSTKKLKFHKTEMKPPSGNPTPTRPKKQ